MDPSTTGVAMTDTTSIARDNMLREFEGAWRDGSPVFGCCRKTVATAIEQIDVYELATADPARRVHMLRKPVETALPGHLAGHRCCANHLADLAFDAPDLIAAPVHAG
jgi:hypothetical protein